MPKIELSRLKKIIREEMSALREGTEHDAASKQMSLASKLLGAIETFKESATEKAKSELGQNLDAVEKTLNRIVSSPMQYVDATTPPETKKKIVSLKPQKTGV